MLVNVAMMRILRRMMATAMVSTSDAWVKGSRLWWGWASVVCAHRHCCYLSHITAYTNVIIIKVLFSIHNHHNFNFCFIKRTNYTIAEDDFDKTSMGGRRFLILYDFPPLLQNKWNTQVYLMVHSFMTCNVCQFVQ